MPLPSDGWLVVGTLLDENRTAYFSLWPGLMFSFGLEVLILLFSALTPSLLMSASFSSS